VIFLVMGIALAVLVLWSVASTPRVIRRTCPRTWIWWACWLTIGSTIAQALIAQGREMTGLF
jgi:hypothetical protein